jgi:hypothetical protein
VHLGIDEDQRGSHNREDNHEDDGKHREPVERVARNRQRGGFSDFGLQLRKTKPISISIYMNKRNYHTKRDIKNPPHIAHLYSDRYPISVS